MILMWLYGVSLLVLCQYQWLHQGGSGIVGKVALLDVRRSIGYIFSPINRVRRFKKDVKFESVQDSCDRLPCVIASSLKPLSSCHKQCNHILA